MRYIKLYESFESDKITKTMGYLKRSGVDVKNFLNDVKSVLIENNIAASKLSDDDVKYVKSINVKNSNLDDIIFWFSLKEGYLISTKTVSKVESNNGMFSRSTIRYLESKYDTGGLILTPVVDYSSLETGDRVLAYLDDASIENLTIGIIYIEDASVYIIHNNIEKDGQAPTSDYSEYGTKSWIIASSGSSHGDYYTHSDHEYLHLMESTGSLEDDTVSHFPLRNGRMVKWGNYNHITYRKLVSDSDFCLTFNLSEVSRKYGNIGDIRKYREESRKDATSLMSDVDMKLKN